MLFELCVCRVWQFIHVWPFLSFCYSFEGSGRSLCGLTSCQVNCFFLSPDVFLVSVFTAKICIRVVNEKHQILSNVEIRTLSNWRDMLARSTWVVPVFPLACLSCEALCPSDICGSINKLQWFLLLIQILAAGLLSRSFEVVTPVAACI